MPGQPVERAGNLQGNAGPYQNVLDARQHGAVKRRQMRDLELFQEVDAYGIAVALARQNYLHEVGGNAQLLELARAVMSVQRQQLVCSALCLPARNVIRLKNTRCHGWKRKLLERAAYVPAVVAVLQTARQHLVQRRP